MVQSTLCAVCLVLPAFSTLLASRTAALAPRCCLHRVLACPRSQQTQIREWQQKHRQLLGCAGRSSAALAPGCWLRHILDNPMSQQTLIPKWQQSTKTSCMDVLDVPQLILHLAAVSSKGWITPNHNSPRFQKHHQLLGCAGRSSAALAPGCCLRQRMDRPRSQQPQIQEWQQRHS